MGDFKDLKVWQRSRELMVVVHHLAGSLPKPELAEMAEQIRRSSLSIPSNIAEGNGRESNRDQARFYRIAQGSARELESQLTLLNDLEMLGREDWERASACLEEVCKMLTGLLRYCGRREAERGRKPLTQRPRRSPPT